MKDILLFIDNKEKILTFLGGVPMYLYIILFFIIIIIIYLFLKSKGNSKTVSGGSVLIEGDGNTVIK